MLQLVLDYLALEKVQRPANVRLLITCGEALPVTVPQKAWTCFGTQVVFANLYGPTEGEMTVWTVPSGRELRTARIGRPINGSAVYVVRDRRDGKVDAADAAAGMTPRNRKLADMLE